jgi:hypothetical protein
LEQIWPPFLCSDTELCHRTVLLCFKDLPLQGILGMSALTEDPNATGTQMLSCTLVSRQCESVILKLTKNDSKQSVKSQCHLAASVENTVTQLILVFTTLTSRPILVKMYNKMSANPFYGISEFLIIATCNPYTIHININTFTLFNYYTNTCSELR